MGIAMRGHLAVPGVLAVVLAWGCAAPATRARPQPAAAPDDRIARVDDALAPGLEVQAGCSETELRTPVVMVSWRADRAPDTSQRLDVAASKQGFDRGHFVKVSLGAQPRIESSATLRAAPHGLGRTFEFAVEPAAFDRAQGRSQVRVSRLEPGVVYFMRVARQDAGAWVSSKTVRIDVPVCVADIVEERP